MNILVDITHPAHVHVFRHAIGIWRAHGHRVTVTTRAKDITLDLLRAYAIEAEPLSTAPRKKSLRGFAAELALHCWRLGAAARRAGAEVLLQVAGTFVAPVGRLLDIATVGFYDTEFARLSNAIAYPLLDAICVPDCYQGSAGRGEVRYPSYHELAYLHPDRFAADPAVVEANGLRPRDKIFVLRFVGWAAAHDYGESGLDLAHKRALVAELARLGQVLISAEGPLPPELERHRSRVPYDQIHHVLAHAQLVAGESATMASEAAVLGVPAVFISKTGRGYTDEQERRYGLVRNYGVDDQDEAVAAMLAIARRPRDPTPWQARRQRLLADKIDLTAWMVDFIENRRWQGVRAAARTGG